MKIKQQKQRGFALAEALIVLVVIAILCGVAFFVLNKNKTKNVQVTAANAQEVANDSKVKIKHLGVNLGTYDPASNKAGDFVFTKDTMSFNMLFLDYGFVVPATSAGPEKRNPQPTFILPLGTKVHAMIDGEVSAVTKLYSNDYSVLVKGNGNELVFETEHVVNVKVKVGDKVKAGDVIAEVSGYDSKNYAGMGLVEIGVLSSNPGKPPAHICPFDYLDDSIKADTLNKITALQKSWEEYRGDSNIYDESKTVIPGCMSREPIEG